MCDFWRRVMKVFASKDVMFELENLNIQRDTNIKIDDIAILEYIIYDEIENQDTEESSETD